MSLLHPQLDAFMAIAEQKTVHGAAASLHLTQTAVTQRLRGLENKLNLSLFVRSRRGMLLTAEGKSLLRYCYANRELELAALQQTGTEIAVELCITGPTSLMSSRIITQCVPIMSQFPNLLLHFDITDRENRDITLRNGQSQLAILQTEQLAKEMQHKILQPEQYVLVCSHQWQGRTLNDILKNEYIIDYTPDDRTTFEYLKHHNLQEQAQGGRHFVNRTESLATMIAAGVGYGLLTKEFSKPYIHNKQLKILNHGKSLTNELCLAWFPRPKQPPYLEALISAIN